MKTISTAYYEKMAEAKQTFCAFCMRGAMPFLESCEDCKVNRMFKAAQALQGAPDVQGGPGGHQ